MQLPDQPPHDHGKILDHSAGIGEVNQDEIERRARELAEIDGFDAEQVNEGHRFRARQEMLGSAEADGPNDASGEVADLISEDDVREETGGAVATTTDGDTDQDEQTIGEELYREGIDEAEHDRMTASRHEERQDS